MPNDQHLMVPERPKGHFRFSDTLKKMKLPRLRSKGSIRPPPATSEMAQCSDTEFLSDPEANSSASSAIGSTGHCTDVTSPSSASRLSLRSRSRTNSGVTSSDGPRTSSRPKSGSVGSGRRYSNLTSSSSPTLTPSPRAPRIHSIVDQQYVHQNVLLVSGEAGTTEPCGTGSNGTVIVHHHLDGYPATKWPVCNGYFKAIVRLDSGPNRVRFEYVSSKGASFTSDLTINYMPLTANPPLHLVVLVGSDFRDRDLQSAGVGEAVRRDQGGKIDIAVRKLRIAGYLVQAFTGDQLYRNRMGRRCFRFEEEWSNDSLSSRDDRVMRNLAKVHVVRADSSVDEIRGLEAAGNGNAIRELVRDAVDSYFGRRFADKRYIGVVVLDAIGDLRLPGIKDTSALGGGLGIVGSKGFHSLTTTIEGVTSMFSDCSRIGTDVGTSDSSETGFIWESATVTLGNILEAFVSPQPQIVPRGFGHLNRTFITKEPYSLRSKTPGLSPSMPKDEDTWPRIDCLRMRFHPCFRLPTDPMPLDVPEIPQVFALETGLVASATSGIALIMVFLDGVFSDFFDFTQKPEREVFLNDRTLRAKIPDLPKASPNVMLRILSAGQGEAIMDDFTAAVNEAKINIPIGHGTVYKSGAYGTLSSNKDSGADHHIIFNSITAGSLLIAIRVYHSLCLNALEFIYEDKSTQLFGTKPKDDSASTEFPIDARRGEILMGFCMRSKGAVRGLEILTSFGRRSDCFGGIPLGGNMTTLIPPKGRALAGVYGSCLDDFAILYK